VDPRAGLGDLEKRKFLTPPGLELRPLGRPVAIPTTLSRLLLNKTKVDKNGILIFKYMKLGGGVWDIGYYVV
jgi:hypothetical protein